MPLLSIVLTLALVGLVVWLVTNYIPMPEPFKKLIIVVCVVALIIWIMQIAGVTGPVMRLRL